MKLFIAGHFLILSFIVLGLGVWKDRLVLAGIVFLVLQVIGISIVFLNKKEGTENV